MFTMDKPAGLLDGVVVVARFWFVIVVASKSTVNASPALNPAALIPIVFAEVAVLVTLVSGFTVKDDAVMLSVPVAVLYGTPLTVSDTDNMCGPATKFGTVNVAAKTPCAFTLLAVTVAVTPSMAINGVPDDAA